MNKHTPTPWSLDPYTSADIRGDDGLDLAIAISKPMEGTLDIVAATVGPLTRDAAKANAAHIVHCVNSHDELTNALASERMHKGALISRIAELEKVLELAKAALYEHGDARYTAPVVEKIEVALKVKP